MKKQDFLILGIIIFIALVFRLYKINTPLADLHSWRQVDTAAVGRNFARGEFNLLKPQYDDLSSIQSGIENPEGLRFVEFPLYSAIFGGLYRYLPIPSITVEMYGRITTIFFSLLIISVLYYLALKEHSRTAAIFAALTYAIFPFFAFFSRVVLPETMAVSCMFIAIFFLYLFTNGKKKNYIWLVLSILFYATSILVKPTPIFYSLSIGYLFIMKYKFDVFKQWEPYVYAILGIAPFVAWRMYIVQFPEGIPASSWLFAYVNTFEGPKNIFFKPAFFRWIFMERIGIGMLGVFMSFFLLLGVTGNFKKYFIHSILFSAIVYLLTFQGGNVQHEYYQTIALPAFAIVIGLGIAHLIYQKNSFNHIIAYPLIAGVLGLSFFFSYYKVKDYYNYPNDLPEIAKLIMTFTNPEDKIVTDRLGDTTLLYLADRKGAPAIYKEIPELQKMGYSYLITDKKDLTEDLKEQGLTVLVENQQFSIIKL